MTNVKLGPETALAVAQMAATILAGNRTATVAEAVNTALEICREVNKYVSDSHRA